jgi:hypothetical protein
MFLSPLRWADRRRRSLDKRSRQDFPQARQRQPTEMRTYDGVTDSRQWRPTLNISPAHGEYKPFFSCHLSLVIGHLFVNDK